MSALEKNLYKQISVKSTRAKDNIASSVPTYKGFSTVNSENSSPALYDIALIKQDIINHFHIRQGEKLSDPEFGTIIWDIIFEPLTEDTINAIIQNVSRIVNYDPRVKVNKIDVKQPYRYNIRLKAFLTSYARNRIAKVGIKENYFIQGKNAI
jgi:phage baseplate assembly protein W